MFSFNVITLFPEMFSALHWGIVGRAQEKKIIEIQYSNPRDFTEDPYRTVDDRPYGGGPGMVMKAEPLYRAILDCKQRLPSAKVVFLSPKGKPLTQRKVQEYSDQKSIILLSGRYEGIDQRLLNKTVDEELSIGDYVLSGGELPAMILIDAVTRLLPGALGDEQSAKEDSFSDGLLDHPHFTRPENWRGETVPAVLMEGHHKAIQTWRLKQSLGQTWLKRPDLLEKRQNNEIEQKLLQEFINEWEKN